jgi:hypothetical protein
VIRALILDTTGRKEQPHGGGAGPTNVIKDLKSILESMLPWSSVDGYTEKVQSFYPVCKYSTNLSSKYYYVFLPGSRVSKIAQKTYFYRYVKRALINYIITAVNK